MKRITSIDITRGIVMIIMALDHTRDLLHKTSLTQQPTDLSTTTPVLFFTRFITHLCAPTFVFLAGVSAFISSQKINDVATHRKQLLSRGVALLILEFTLVNFGMFFDLHFRVFLFEVIVTIGTGFIILALLLRCSTLTIGLIGLLLFFFHDLIATISISNNAAVQQTFNALFAPGAFPFGERLFVMIYSPVPWLSILLLGFSTGKLFLLPVTQKRKYFLSIGTCLIVVFLIFRLINKFGDSPWTKQKSEALTIVSFLNVTKYPPSVQFGLLMLGIMFLILYCVEGLKNRFTGITSTYGKVPLFYFIVHWYILHSILFLIIFLQGYKFSDFVFGFNFGRPEGASGVNLTMVYFIWICLVALMYPLCKWFGRYKENNKQNKWLRYV